MNRILYISCLCFWIFFSNSHIMAQDMQRLAERHTMGTARYVGMGGAMTAIGGDPSAVLDNPAGLGLYRRSELTISFDETIDLTALSTTPSDTYVRDRFSAPNVAAVWARGIPSKQRGLIYNNFILSMNRLANFHRDVVAKGANLGMVNTICNITNGLPEESVQNQPWANKDVAWLSILGYETYLIDPAANNQWVPAVDFTEGSLHVSESGHSDQYTISWAGNFSHQWYIGVGLNIPTITYTKQLTLSESNHAQSANLQSTLQLRAVGVNATIGAIYRPIQALRLGFSVQSPTVLNLSMQTSGEMSSKMSADKNYYLATDDARGVATQVISPFRTSLSVAGQLGEIGMLALQYDFARSSQMKDVHTFRAGLEAQVNKDLFFNAGYVYESLFLQDDPIWMLAANDIRTDMDYRYNDYSQYISAGFGYRSDSMIAQLAYQYRWQNLHQYASEEHRVPFEIMTHTHRVVATLAWRF